MEFLTSKQMAKVDEISINKYNIGLLQMMEKAGKNLANFVSKLKPKPKKVIVFYGKGNNAGGGLVAARYLAKNKIKVELIAASEKVNENVKYQLKRLLKLKIKYQKSFKVKKVKTKNNHVIIDALLGYNIKGKPKNRFAFFIKKINSMHEKGVKVVSLDLPSGIDPDKGAIYKPTVKADYTLTLALPKKGLKKLKNVYLVNIGIPIGVYQDLGIKTKNYFSKTDIVKIS